MPRRTPLVDCAVPDRSAARRPGPTIDDGGARQVMARKQKKGRLSGSGRAIGRLLSMTAFLPIASRAPIYAQLIWALVLDERTPMGRKALLAGALGYLVLPADLIPDRIPLIGGLDDLVVVVLAVDLFLDGVPSEVLGEKLDELGIERSAFDRDVAQIRRIMPAPVRRAIRRVPQAVGLGMGALRSTRIGPRVRAWITKEGSLA